MVFDGTSLALATNNIREKKFAGGKDGTEEQLHRLAGIRRFLLQVEAVHAVSWLSPSGTPLIAHGAESKGRATATLALRGDAAYLEAKGSTTQGARGCAVQVGADVEVCKASLA